jgi:Alkylmercury lyase
MIFTGIRSRRFWHVGALATLLAASIGGLAGRPAMAHQTKCPYCRLDVVQDTAEQDNEVALNYGRKRIEYRCVYCALSQAKSDYKGDITVLAPSEIKGKPVLISRAGDKWSVRPETAVFAGVKVNHEQCQVGYRAFSNRAAFDAYAQKHPDLLKDARPLTLAEMVEIAK